MPPLPPTDSRPLRPQLRVYSLQKVLDGRFRQCFTLYHSTQLCRMRSGCTAGGSALPSDIRIQCDPRSTARGSRRDRTPQLDPQSPSAARRGRPSAAWESFEFSIQSDSATRRPCAGRTSWSNSRERKITSRPAAPRAGERQRARARGPRRKRLSVGRSVSDGPGAMQPIADFISFGQ
eukprot:SAG11_NODE_1990_length_3957_cov_4.708917_4_plen_178_part_00